MKIVHLCLACFFPDGYSYQENMLPKFHKLLGYDVEVIASLETFDNYGKAVFLGKSRSYENENGIKVTRLNNRKPTSLFRILRRFENFGKVLSSSTPDIIFIHGCQFLDISEVVKYAKTHKVKIYADNHSDFSNSATNFLSKNILHKIIWRHCAKKIEPYTKKFYGVLPARVDFLKNVYKLPPEKCELLVMGGDDELIDKASKPEVRQKIREKYGIADDDFLVITGGKIDGFKTQTLLLMQAVKNIDNPKLKLIVFGSVTKELEDKVNALADGKRVQYIGWVQSMDSYDYFASADLAVFPGRHSVFWEQVAAQGIPEICKRWDGTCHVDLGGNVIFLENDSAKEIQRNIQDLLDSPEKYKAMKKTAEEKGRKYFSYKDIAKRSIEG